MRNRGGLAEFCSCPLTETSTISTTRIRQWLAIAHGLHGRSVPWAYCIRSGFCGCIVFFWKCRAFRRGVSRLPAVLFACTPAKRIGQNRSRESELVHFQHGAKSAEDNGKETREDKGSFFILWMWRSWFRIWTSWWLWDCMGKWHQWMGCKNIPSAFWWCNYIRKYWKDRARYRQEYSWLWFDYRWFSLPRFFDYLETARFEWWPRQFI